MAKLDGTVNYVRMTGFVPREFAASIHPSRSPYRLVLSPPSVLIVCDIKRFGRSNVADLDLSRISCCRIPAPLPFIVGFSFDRVLTLEANTFNAATLVLIKAKMDTAISGLGRRFSLSPFPPVRFLSLSSILCLSISQSSVASFVSHSRIPTMVPVVGTRE